MSDTPTNPSDTTKVVALWDTGSGRAFSPPTLDMSADLPISVQRMGEEQLLQLLRQTGRDPTQWVKA